MHPRDQAAYKLARWALFFLPPFVAVLLLLFGVIEWRQQQAVAALQNAAIAASHYSATQPDIAALDRLLKDLDAAVDHPPGDPEPLRRRLAQAGELVGIEPDQRQILQDCITAAESPPETQFRKNLLAACRDVVRRVRANASENCVGCSLQQLTALARQAEEGRAAFRASWLQAAQLILLNLMLPLLTGLFGYLFGRDSAARGDAAHDTSTAERVP